jgi:endonuclease YncB( thermonuclease family)
MTRSYWCLGLLLATVTASLAEPPRVFEPNATNLIIAPGDESFSAEDGDSFWLGAFRIRLDGIDAVEPGQQCTLGDGRHCSEAARIFLARIFETNKVACTFVLAKNGRPKMSYGRYVSRCSTGESEDNINRLMLSSGMAFAAENSADENYRALVSVAQAEKAGVHGVGNIQHPAAYRRISRTSKKISDIALIDEIGLLWGSLSEELQNVIRRLIAACGQLQTKEVDRQPHSPCNQ